jgi:lipoate-protein ligase B
MGYLLCSLPRHGLKVRDVVGALEEGLIRFLADEGLEAGRDCGHPGVWVEGKKIGSIGLHLKHGVSMHGFCLNLSPTMEHFSLLQPCGLSPDTMTSMDQCLSRSPSAVEAAPRVAGKVLGAISELRRLDGTGGRE